MSLDSIVQVNITVQASAVTQAGFGVPLIAAYDAPFGERVRFYASTTAMISDGFSASSATVRAASAIFSQNPHPPLIAVGRMALTPTQILEITPTAEDTREYKVTINGTEFTFTSDATATVAEITLGLVTAINLGSEPMTAADVTTHFTLTEDVPGAINTVELDDDGEGNLLAREDTTLDPGTGTDLAAILAAEPGWYALALTLGAATIITAAATFIEANGRLLVTASADSDVPTTATDDIASTLETAGFARTSLIAHPKPHQYAGAAWLGVMLPKDPGSATWKFKTLRAVDKVVFTETELANLEGKNANHYTEVAGIGITQQGVSASGEFLDITRGIDWLRARLQERIFSRLANLDKIAFTDPGIAIVDSEIRAQLAEATESPSKPNNLLAADPPAVVNVPLASAVSSVNKANRLLPDVTFSATLAGAVHAAEIAGTVSV